MEASNKKYLENRLLKFKKKIKNDISNFKNIENDLKPPSDKFTKKFKIMLRGFKSTILRKQAGVQIKKNPLSLSH